MSSKPQTPPPALPATTRNSLFDIERGWIPLLEARVAAETDPELSSDRPVCLHCGGRGENPNGSVSNCPACEGSGRSKSERELAIEAADVALADHATKEVEKADSYIGLIGFLEAAVATRRAEAKRHAEMARVTEGMLAQVKATGLFAMGVLGRKRIDGNRGYLLAKANGGVAPLLVANPELVPDDCCRMEGWVRADLWALALDLVRSQPGPLRRGTRINDYSMKRVPDNVAIRAKLTEPCPACGGTGRDKIGCRVDCVVCHLHKAPRGRSVPVEMALSLCSHECIGYAVDPEPGSLWPNEEAHSGMLGPVCCSCGGSGKQAVPGAAIGERGSHLEVK